VKLVQLRRRKRREKVGVEGVNLAGAFSAVRRIAVSRHVEGLVLLVCAEEIVGESQLVGFGQFVIELAQ
jgi:hypothetical protein